MYCIVDFTVAPWVRDGLELRPIVNCCNFDR